MRWAITTAPQSVKTSVCSPPPLGLDDDEPGALPAERVACACPAGIEITVVRRASCVAKG